MIFEINMFDLTLRCQKYQKFKLNNTNILTNFLIFWSWSLESMSLSLVTWVFDFLMYDYFLWNLKMANFNLHIRLNTKKLMNKYSYRFINYVVFDFFIFENFFWTSFPKQLRDLPKILKRFLKNAHWISLGNWRQLSSNDVNGFDAIVKIVHKSSNFVKIVHKSSNFVKILFKNHNRQKMSKNVINRQKTT